MFINHMGWLYISYLNVYHMASKQFVSTVDTRYLKLTKLVLQDIPRDATWWLYS